MRALFLSLVAAMLMGLPLAAHADVTYNFTLTSSTDGHVSGNGSFSLNQPPPATGKVAYSFRGTLPFTPGFQITAFSNLYDGPAGSRAVPTQPDNTTLAYIEYTDGVMSRFSGFSFTGGTASCQSNLVVGSNAYSFRETCFINGGPPDSYSDSGTVVITPAAITGPNSPTSFDPTNVQMNGSALQSGNMLRLTAASGGSNQAGSAFYKTPVGVQTFTTEFTFRLTDAQADGFMFVVQNSAPTALGLPGQFLGFGGIPKSAGVKFDLYNNGGEGNNSTGIYSNITWPVPNSTDLSPSGVNLHSGNIMKAHITYDGFTLFVNLSDTVTQRLFSNSYSINLPGVMGANTAYIGFTGGTGGLSATQDILSWTYQSGVAVAPPTFNANSIGAFAASTVALVAQTGATIYYTVDGTVPTTGSTQYVNPIVPVGATDIRAIAVLNGASSPIAERVITNSLGPIGDSYVPVAWQDNGSATGAATGNDAAPLVLTSNGTNQAGSAFYPKPVNIQSFIADFDFLFYKGTASSGDADGLMFVIQNQGPTALGSYGQFLGFGGIAKSVAVKFDIYNNAGEGDESTGLYLNGAWPTLPGFDLTNSGLQLRNPNYAHAAHITYANKILTVTITGATSVPVTQVYSVDIPAVVGGNTAYIGFTGGTGGLTTYGTVSYLLYIAP